VSHLQVNPIPEGQDQIGFDEPLPPVPEYKPWKDPVEKSVAFEQLDALFEQRIGMIDGAMGTNIQDYKLDENDYRGERYKVCFLLS
jgi:5-methyltetrahydrofolate--homocysteine methyltransferase